MIVKQVIVKAIKQYLKTKDLGKQSQLKKTK
jgi:hypothetical protein